MWFVPEGMAISQATAADRVVVPGYVYIIVMFGLLALAYYVFGVLVPRLTARRCPDCRAILTKELTDEWKDRAEGAWTGPAYRLVRYACPSCDHVEAVWVKWGPAARPMTADDKMTEAEVQTELLGKVPDRIRPWIKKTQEAEDKQGKVVPNPSDEELRRD